jgi:peptidoglycan/LPS O-acetylase OafA/YrhL
VYFVAGVFTLLAMSLHSFDRRLMNVMWLRGIINCGRMCYSLYLIHLPVTNFVRAGLEIAGVGTSSISPFLTVVLCGAPSIWIAWWFHCAVERRFMSPAASLLGARAVAPVAIGQPATAGTDT